MAHPANSIIATLTPPSSMAKITLPPSAAVNSAVSAATSRLGVYRKSRCFDERRVGHRGIPPPCPPIDALPISRARPA